MIKRIWVAVVAALVAGMGLVGSAPTLALADEGDVARASVDVYTTPGYHEVNGRKWHTTCEKYSATERCRAEIWATQVRFIGGQYRETTGWFFNNLTYKPAKRELWVGNPLANKGTWTSEEGRQWKTECETAETGRNGCRSYIISKDIVVKTVTPRTYERVDRWVFNNIVQFSVKPVDPPPVPKVWCDNAPLPYNMALRNRDGMPYYPKSPYDDPENVYNPTSIANFIKNVSKDSRLNTQQRTCLAELGGKHLIDGSHTEGTGENTVRWFGYRFDFSANPNLPDLSGEGDGWFSGLAQGGGLSAFVELDKITNDDKWLEYGRQVFRSFDVPMSSGGIANHINVEGNDVLWFEEYPTNPATSVLNGHLEAIIALDIWSKATGDQHAKDLVNKALDGLEPVLKQEQIDVQGGILTSYDLVRGYTDKGRDYKASPIRLVSTNTTQRPTAVLNGTPVTVPLVTNPANEKPSRIKDPGMTGPGGRWSDHWQQITTSSNAKMVGGRIVATTDGKGWQGVSQVIPANTFDDGKKLALSLNAQLTTPGNGTKAGASGKVAVYQLPCKGEPTQLLFESQKMRSAQKTDYTFSFKPKYVGCQMLLQLTTSSYGNTGTKISYDDVYLREADAVGNNASKFEIAPNNNDRFKFIDRFVYNQPVSELTLSGKGTVQVQAYEDGRWQEFHTVTLKAGQEATTVELPERITGRNIHYGYHESHVGELTSLYNRTKADMKVGKEREFLRQYALSWVKMAPSKIGSIPDRFDPDARARMMVVDDPGDTYELEVIDPFSLLEDEWSSLPEEE